MALSRRTGSRFQANIWPGFVDAMTGLLLVLTFVLIGATASHVLSAGLYRSTVFVEDSVV